MRLSQKPSVSGDLLFIVSNVSFDQIGLIVPDDHDVRFSFLRSYCVVFSVRMDSQSFYMLHVFIYKHTHTHTQLALSSGKDNHHNID